MCFHSYYYLLIYINSFLSIRNLKWKIPTFFLDFIYAYVFFEVILSLLLFMVILMNFSSMSIKYQILKVEIKSNKMYITIKIIRNGAIEIFNSIPIENINLLIENFKLNDLDNLS